MYIFPSTVTFLATIQTFIVIKKQLEEIQGVFLVEENPKYNWGEKSVHNRLLQVQNTEKPKCKANVNKLAARNYITSPRVLKKSHFITENLSSPLNKTKPRRQ